ncbi:periphilin-1 isoform X2 [Fukomys damarensis]|uniref:periphilin-1 isoform X2 n=1 Tax=Fukomys damarensis TaxID=885580 RepID=UPI0005400C02|nr:periphilin-1 isoform X2 [Fukomys damarensis]
MFNPAASSSYSAYAAFHNLWYLALTQQQAPALLGGQQQPLAGPFPFRWLWNRVPPVSSLLEKTFPPLATVKTPGQQILPAPENNNSPTTRRKRSTKTKKEVAEQPVISEQQTDDIEQSTEPATVPEKCLTASEGEENTTAQEKGEPGEGLPVMSGPQTAQVKSEPGDGLPVMQSGTPTSQVKSEPVEGLCMISSGPPTAQVKGEPGDGLPRMSSGPVSAQVKSELKESIPVIIRGPPRAHVKVADRTNAMWSEGRYDYERLPRERVPPRSDPSDGYHRVVNIVPKKPPLLEKKPPLLEKKPPLLEKKPPLLDRPGEGSYSRYYSHVGYREYDQGRSFSHDRRSGPPHRGDESGYRWSRDDHSASRQTDYREMRDGFRRKNFYSSHYMRDRSPHKRDAPFFRESSVGRKDSPHSRSGSSVSSRSYSPDRSKTYSFHQSQHRSKERQVQSLKTSRDTSPSSSSAGPSSKVLDKPSRLTEKEFAEAASKWAAEKLEKSDESSSPGISEFQAGPTAPLFSEQPEEPETNAADSTGLLEDSQRSSRSKAIASKTKEIEQVYRQDCETFGMVVKMLIEKDPSLEKSIQFALRQNLHEIGERCVEELKHFIAEYDTSTQDFGEPF